MQFYALGYSKCAALTLTDFNTFQKVKSHSQKSLAKKETFKVTSKVKNEEKLT